MWILCLSFLLDLCNIIFNKKNPKIDEFSVDTGEIKKNRQDDIFIRIVEQWHAFILTTQRTNPVRSDWMEKRQTQTETREKETKRTTWCMHDLWTIDKDYCIYLFALWLLGLCNIMRSNGRRRWIVDGLTDVGTFWRGSELTIRCRWVCFNGLIKGVLGEWGGRGAAGRVDLQVEPAFSLQFTCEDWEQ